MSYSTLAQASVTELKGVGAALAQKLAKIHIFNQQDLLFHLPYRYQDRTRLTPIGSLQMGQACVVRGVVRGASVMFGKRRSLLVRISDGSGTLSLRFFHFSAAQKNQFRNGAEVHCFGEVRIGSTGPELYHPEYRMIKEDQPEPMEEHLTPLYPTTEGLNQTRIRGLVEQVLPKLYQDNALTEWLPENLLSRMNLLPLQQAVMTLHKPKPDVSLLDLERGSHPAQTRLAFEELLAHNLSLQALRAEAQKEQAPVLDLQNSLFKPLMNSLPFQLTGAQQRVIEDIRKDISKGFPMLRLVQGDVGSGKTLVALFAAVIAMENGYQAAIMAPTEILAEQHFANMTQLLEPLGIKVAWLVGKQTKKQRQAQLSSIVSGEAALAVGTHALFQDAVEFHQLGLIVIDEQHRFGVHQRLALREKGEKNGQVPHQLIMTATPIPRTLAMSAYADLDNSIIDELPPGRKPVTTNVVSQQRRTDVVARVASACAEGRQVYWVCTLIEESEELQCQAAEESYEVLKLALPELRIGLVHGRMKPAEKASVMKSFKSHELDLLVATTVIEVGVDVPNASVMIIENPERLGLAQLHQLRGRVGRGSADSYCLLLYSTPLSQQGKERLAVMRDTSDGFAIAEKDLELRGPGEVLGTRQTGMMQFRVADLDRHQHLMEQVNDTARELAVNYPVPSQALIERWLNQASKYGQV